jgi:hypothetical protein
MFNVAVKFAAFACACGVRITSAHRVQFAQLHLTMQIEQTFNANTRVAASRYTAPATRSATQR